MNIGVLFSILSLLAMSVAPVLNKFATGGIGWAWGAALSSLFCLLFCLITQPRILGKFANVKSLFSKSLLMIAVTNSLGLLCQYGAVMRLDPPTMSILGRMYVVFAIILAQFVLKEKRTRLESFTLILVLFGAALFCWSPKLSSDWIGISLCLAYCLFFALTHMQVKLETKRTSANTVLFSNNLLSSLLLLPIAGFLAGPAPQANSQGVLLILAASFFGGWLGLLLFYESLKRISMVRANFIRTFSPIAGVLVAWPFFPVQFSSLQFCGGAIMISALIIQALAKLEIQLHIRKL